MLLQNSRGRGPYLLQIDIHVAPDLRRLIREEVELALQGMESPGSTGDQSDSVGRTKPPESRGASSDSGKILKRGQ